MPSLGAKQGGRAVARSCDDEALLLRARVRPRAVKQATHNISRTVSKAIEGGTYYGLDGIGK